MVALRTVFQRREITHAWSCCTAFSTKTLLMQIKHIILFIYFCHCQAPPSIHSSVCTSPHIQLWIPWHVGAGSSTLLSGLLRSVKHAKHSFKYDHLRHLCTCWSHGKIPAAKCVISKILSTIFFKLFKSLVIELVYNTRKRDRLNKSKSVTAGLLCYWYGTQNHGWSSMECQSQQYMILLYSGFGFLGPIQCHNIKNILHPVSNVSVTVAVSWKLLFLIRGYLGTHPAGTSSTFKHGHLRQRQSCLQET